MKKIVKWIGVVLAALLVISAVAAAAMYTLSSQDFERTYDIDPVDIVVPTDDKSIARGKHLVTTRGCRDCHGKKMQGSVVMDNFAMGAISAPNLTAGQGSVTTDYTDQDWVRAIHHGVAPNGKPLLFMPSNEYTALGQADLKAMVAYLESLPAVDHPSGEVSPGPLARMLYLKGSMPILVPAETIDHDQPLADVPERGPTREYGEYLASACQGCHGKSYSGGDIAGMPPDFPPAANLTPHETGLKGWSRQDFTTVLRTGQEPSGARLDNKYMPWKVIGQMTDDEIAALYAYFHSLEPIPTGAAPKRVD